MLQKTLQRHVRSKHLAPAFPCDICGQTFKRKDSYDRHFAEQHGDEKDSTIECMKCGKHIRARSLTDHLKSKLCAKTDALMDATGRFDIPTVVGMVDIISQLFVEVRKQFIPMKGIDAYTEDIWKLRALALRTIHRRARSIDDPIQGGLCWAMAAMATLEGNLGLPSGRLHKQMLTRLVPGVPEILPFNYTWRAAIRERLASFGYYRNCSAGSKSLCDYLMALGRCNADIHVRVASQWEAAGDYSFECKPGLVLELDRMLLWSRAQRTLWPCIDPRKGSWDGQMEWTSGEYLVLFNETRAAVAWWILAYANDDNLQDGDLVEALTDHFGRWDFYVRVGIAICSKCSTS